MSTEFKKLLDMIRSLPNPVYGYSMNGKYYPRTDLSPGEVCTSITIRVSGNSDHTVIYLSDSIEVSTVLGALESFEVQFPDTPTRLGQIPARTLRDITRLDQLLINMMAHLPDTAAAYGVEARRVVGRLRQLAVTQYPKTALHHGEDNGS